MCNSTARHNSHDSAPLRFSCMNWRTAGRDGFEDARRCDRVLVAAAVGCEYVILSDAKNLAIRLAPDPSLRSG